MKSTYTLAIDSHRLALIKRDRNRFLIDHLCAFEPHVKPLETLKPVLHRKVPQIVSGLSAKDVILRRIHLKLKTKREVLAALPFQLEDHLPFPADETIVIPTLHLGKQGTDVDLLATTQEKLRSHLLPLEEKGIHPDVVTAEPIALFRFAQYLFPEHASLLVYHSKNQMIAVMKDRALVAFQSVRDGDIQRAFAYVQKKYPEIEQVLNIGSTPLETSLQCLKVENEDWIPYAISIGMALDAAKNDPQSRQFRQGPLRSLKNKRKDKIKTAVFFASCVLFCVSILTFGQLKLHFAKMEFLTSLNFPPEASLQQVASDLKTALRKKPKASLPLSTVPPVHEVIAWLSAHPSLGDEATISRLQYQMTKCPRLGTQAKTFAAKVDIEFSTSLPRVARAFYESLLQEGEFTDQGQKINFSSGQDVYKVSFFLKSRVL